MVSIPPPGVYPPPGIYVPVPTFFVGKQAATYNPVAAPLDIATQAAHALYLARAGIRGLVILGSTGEAVHLTNEERSAVLAGVRAALEDAGFKDYPILAGTATQNIEETVGQLRAAKEAGAQWGMCLAPGYFAGASTQEGIVQWFTAVADQSPIPILMCVSSTHPPPPHLFIPSCGCTSSHFMFNVIGMLGLLTLPRARG